MPNRFSKTFFWLIAIAFVFAGQGCAGPVSPISAETSTSQATTAFVPASPTPITPTPTVQLETASPTALPVFTPDIISVTAVNGNLFIRRGPGLGYNPIAVLAKGESVTALARDPLTRWLQVSIPGQAGKTGWVSIQTNYSLINGDVMKLPDILPTEWPVGAYLRNCTNHQMIVKPGDTLIPPVSGYPDNEVAIYPGRYSVYDYDLSGQPEVLVVDLREGVEIDIRVDGSGERRKCP
ncbi:MAG: SH3 domain-containing protein [Chloroflexi bacterium]|nr:SH3 domain-containing protein [Chloroflexota bacterium]